MSLRLASDHGVTTVPIGPLVDISAAARGFADRVDSGDIAPERVIIIAVIDGRVDFACFGSSPTIAEGVGLLELAKAKLIDGAWAEA